MLHARRVPPFSLFLVLLCSCSSPGSFSVSGGGKEYGWHAKAAYVYFSPSEAPTQMTLVISDVDSGCAKTGNIEGRKKAFSFQVVAKATLEELRDAVHVQFSPAEVAQTDATCQAQTKMAVDWGELTIKVLETKPGGVVEGYLHTGAPWPGDDKDGLETDAQVNGWFSALVCAEAPATTTECEP